VRKPGLGVVPPAPGFCWLGGGERECVCVCVCVFVCVCDNVDEEERQLG